MNHLYKGYYINKRNEIGYVQIKPLRMKAWEKARRRRMIRNKILKFLNILLWIILIWIILDKYSLIS